MLQRVEFDEAKFLLIEGKGEPAAEEFATKVDALYPLSYAVKNCSKKAGKDLVVLKPEVL